MSKSPTNNKYWQYTRATLMLLALITVPLTVLTQIVFIGLKLSDMVAWSWMVVLSPAMALVGGWILILMCLAAAALYGYYLIKMEADRLDQLRKARALRQAGQIKKAKQKQAQLDKEMGFRPKRENS